jgi:DNA mismatch repair protein MutS
MSNNQFTPMMMHYLSIKKENPDVIILYRLGDFYECFFEDAKVVSKELQLVLTARNAGSTEKVPMCGVPFHALDNYLLKLILFGHKVGIVEQLEDPTLAKGLVKRGIVRIITPGTLVDIGLQNQLNNYLVTIDEYSEIYVVAYTDISTGLLEVKTINKTLNDLVSMLSLYQVKEIVLSPKYANKELEEYCKNNNIVISRQKDIEVTIAHEKYIRNLNDARHCVSVVRLVEYLNNTQKRDIDYLKTAAFIKNNKYVILDSFSRNNLELTKSARNNEKYGSLYWVLDKTKSAMGSRKLYNIINFPLVDEKQINERLDFVEFFVNNSLVAKSISKQIEKIYDLERIVAKIGYGSVSPRDLLQMGISLQTVPIIKKELSNNPNPIIQEFVSSIKDFPDIKDLIERSIVENPPLTTTQGNFIKDNYNNDLDYLRSLSKGGKTFITDLEAVEKEKTGIKNLKIGYNSVTGFYIEVSKLNNDLIKPEFNYIHRQTLLNTERYITPELKAKEDEILASEEKAIAFENELFQEIRLIIKKEIYELQDLGDKLAYLDAIISLSISAIENHYVRPTFAKEFVIHEGRHPVIEKVIGEHEYVPNDIILNDKKILLITGPNMGGKSTYMRQVGLISVMAQIGSFVPAKDAVLPIIDKMFTRIGATDDLVSGQSTFMVEMNETNMALQQGTENSLILFDEIGRGTSTYDGMALAKAIIEYLASNIKAYTLFSTHYHELTNLEGNIPNLKNVSVSVYEENEKITFLYKIQDGPANKSYGLNVARLAKLPNSLIKRAEEVLKELEDKKLKESFVIEKIVEVEKYPKELEDIDPLNMSPMDALQFLYKLKQRK